MLQTASWFSGIYISQESIQTHLRYSGILNDNFTANLYVSRAFITRSKNVKIGN